MGWEMVADLANGIFKRWFSKEAKEESRANEIEKLEREQLTIIANNKGSNNNRLSWIAKRLSELHKEARNSR